VDIKLVAMAGDHPGREIPIEVDEFVIGRGPSCQFQVHADQVSHRHCRILKRSGRVLVEDLHSTNGTLVNDRVIRVVELEDGDRLRVGPVCFRVSIPAGSRDLKERTEDWVVGALEARPRPMATLTDFNTNTPMVATQQAPGRLPDREARERVERPQARPSAARQTHLRVTQEQGIILARIADSALVQDVDIREFDEELNVLVGGGQNRIVLDFGNVEFVSSSAISRLVKYQKQCRAHGGLIRLCKLRREVAQVYKLMNLQRLFELYPDEASALQGEWPAEMSRTVLDLKVLTPRQPAAPPQRDVSSSPPAPPLALGRVHLIVQDGHDKGQAVEVRAPRFAIGRDPSCQLRPNSPAVSRHHAVIEQRHGRVFVRDLGSKNGTWVDDRKLQDEEVEVVHGDRVQVGSLLFRFAIGDGGDPGPRRPDDMADDWLLREGDAGQELSTALFLRTLPAPPAPSPGPEPNPTISTPPGPSNLVADLRHLSYEIVRDALVITIRSPDLDDEATVGPVRHELLLLLDQMASRHVVLRLDAVKYLSSRAVGMLLAHYQRLHRSGGELRLCHVRPDVRKHLEHMRVPMLIEVYPDLDTATLTAWT
jgi:anti-anti-sigma factor